MARRPVVGITAAFERARWAVWDGIEVNLGQRTYTDRVDAAGGIPLLLPASAAGTADPHAVLDRVEALLLSGGADLDPALYGQEPEPGTTNFRRARDEFEIALCRAAIERGMPVLGVCRGLQVLNVARGGDLVQHLDDAELHLHTPGEFCDHEVRLEPGSLVAEAAGTERLEVRSHHHQGVGRLGDGLIASGWAEPGETVESIELPREEGGWTLGILWHTEEEPGSAVMSAFCAAASGNRRSERSEVSA
jgi:putative glutamine amidotransferase